MSLFTFLFITLLGVFVAEANVYPTPIHVLKPHSGSGGHKIPGLNCLSWRLAVETNNLQGWKTVPEECEGYVGHYMLGAQYRRDCAAVTASAYGYVKSLKINKGKDVWIFDIDETTISNTPYYAGVGFGAQPYNSTAFNAWVVEAKAPAIPSALNLYNRLLRLGVKVIFLTGTAAEVKEPRILNLKSVGYHTWEKIIFKEANEGHLTAVEYKSKHRTEIEKMGFRIIGNMGDQWSDLLGPTPGIRTFKLPDPMYYIS